MGMLAWLLAMGMGALFLFGVLWLLPPIIAIVRKKNILLVCLLTLFLSWTVIGWIVALVIACMDEIGGNAVQNADETEALKRKIAEMENEQLKEKLKQMEQENSKKSSDPVQEKSTDTQTDASTEKTDTPKNAEPKDTKKTPKKKK